MTPTLRRATLLATLIFSSLLHAEEEYRIEMWHSETTWAGQGACSAAFSFDIGAMADLLEDIQIHIALVDRAGRRIGKGVLKLESLGGANVNRYGSASLESEAACDENATVIVEKATARDGNKRIDLIKSKRLTARNFRPMNIRIGK